MTGWRGTFPEESHKYMLLYEIDQLFNVIIRRGSGEDEGSGRGATDGGFAQSAEGTHSYVYIHSVHTVYR